MLIFLTCLLLSGVNTTTNDPPPPDVVLIMIDDMGWADPGFMPGGSHDTPHMDALARRGTVFTDATSNGPNCAPSRASLMTGQWTPRHGVMTVGTPKRGKAEHRTLEPPRNGSALTPETITLAQELQAAGYRTAHLGKWHLGTDPTAQGFEINIGGSRAGHPKSYFSPYKNDNLPDGEPGESLTDRLGSEALEIIAADDPRPLFLHLSFFAVHAPLQATPEEIAALQAANPGWDKRKATFAAMMQRTDRNIGRVLEAVGDDAIVVLCSDNGGLSGIGNNGPWRGTKGMLYEGGIRVALVVATPGGSARTTDVPVTLMDLHPTILELAGVDVESNKSDGDSLVPILSGTRDDLGARDLHWHFPAYLEGNRRLGTWRTTPVGVIRRGQWKLHEYFEDGRLELYDLSKDPAETTNLAATEPAIRDELHESMMKWRQEIDAPMPVPVTATVPDSP
ncbi:MAG: sulfatase [Phycisphaerales bacterium]|nr:sulfatase [Phycisphaerales bacterium]